MKHQQREEYIEIVQGCQQLRMKIFSEMEIKVEKSRFYRQVNAQLGKLDYRKLYQAYSGNIRKSQVEPRILFEVLVCAYMLGVYSSRGIERLCRENVQFILILGGHAAPDHCTISRFRSGRKTQEAIEDLFYQYAAVLEEEGFTNHEEVFIDGTKLESRANRYTFVWRKSVEKQLAKIREQAKELLNKQEGYTTRKGLEAEIRRLNKEIEVQGIVVKRGRGHHKPEIVRRRDKMCELLERWNGYEEKKQMLGEGRNSYSKTDPDATFMHMKDDHMRNGQLKPGYNVQFAVNSEFITGVGVYSSRTDYATLPPFLELLSQRHGKKYRRIVADSGYESLANYRYLDKHGQTAYIKPQNYESQKTKKFREQIGRAENMAYYEPKDYFVCKNGRMLVRIGAAQETQKDGTTRTTTRYRCEDCQGCPYRAACCKAKDPQKQKEIVICWEHAAYRQASLGHIQSEEGILLRMNRSIQVEGAFGELKHNRRFTRFLTCGVRNVTTELYLHAMAQNLLKYLAKCNRKQPREHLLHPKSILKF